MKKNFSTVTNASEMGEWGIEGLSKYSVVSNNDLYGQDKSTRAVVVAQLVERLLQIPEVRSSNLVIGKILY